MPFRKGHPFYPGRPQPTGRAVYVAIGASDVPADAVWRPWADTATRRNVRIEFTRPGLHYKRVTDKNTGAVVYYRRVAEWGPVDKARVDAEPPKKRRPYLKLGSHTWFIDTSGLWFLMVVCACSPLKITLRPVTGWDDKHLAEWPYGNELEFPRNNVNFASRLRPLSARKT